MTQNEVVEKLKAYFDKRGNVPLVLLYGSFAKGKANENSDIDVAVHIDESDAEKELDLLLQIRADLELMFCREIDVLNLRTAEGLILSEAVVHSIKVKKDHNLFVKYNLKVIYFNEDVLPMIRRIQNARLERFLNG